MLTPAPLADALLTHMTRVRRAARRAGGRPAELSALSGAQLELVRLVRRRPDVSVADAAAELALAANTVSTLVRQLTDAGTLQRSPDPSDRRIARLRLAPDVGERMTAWRDRRAQAVSEAIDRLPAAERARLTDALPALAQIAEHLEATCPR